MAQLVGLNGGCPPPPPPCPPPNRFSVWRTVRKRRVLRQLDDESQPRRFCNRERQPLRVNEVGDCHRQRCRRLGGKRRGSRRGERTPRTTAASRRSDRRRRTPSAGSKHAASTRRRRGNASRLLLFLLPLCVSLALFLRVELCKQFELDLVDFAPAVAHVDAEPGKSQEVRFRLRRVEPVELVRASRARPARATIFFFEPLHDVPDRADDDERPWPRRLGRRWTPQSWCTPMYMYSNVRVVCQLADGRERQCVGYGRMFHRSPPPQVSKLLLELLRSPK